MQQDAQGKREEAERKPQPGKGWLQDQPEEKGGITELLRVLLSQGLLTNQNEATTEIPESFAMATFPCTFSANREKKAINSFL